MNEANRPLSIAALRETIKRLRSVLAVEISQNGQGVIESIHVTIDSRRSPKQVARDVESVVVSHWGQIDHRKISIAQLRDGEAPGRAPRLQLNHISLSVDRRAAQARVTLLRDEDSYAGVASAASYEYEQVQMVAQATLHAVSEFLHTAVEEEDARPSLAVQQVQEERLAGGDAVVTVTVKLVHRGGDETLVGSALVRRDLWRAAACATLDAINRRLAWFVE